MENYTLQEEIRRRNKPSNVRKKKRLEYALKNLKQKKDAAIAAGALKETRIMNSSSIEKSGPIIDVTATEVKDKKKGDNAQKRSSAIVKRDDKGSTLANRGTKDTETKPPRKPNPYSQKKNKFKGIKGPSKDTINKTVSKIGSAAKSGLSAFTSGYDNQDVKESKTFKQFTELAATAAITSPVWAPKVAGALMTAVGAGGMVYQAHRRNKDKSGESGKSLEQRVNAKNSQGAGGSPGQIFNKKKPIEGSPLPDDVKSNIKNMLNKLKKKNN